MRVAFATALSLPLILTGCALSPTADPTPEPGLAITGSIYGGQQPINQAHVYLMAAGTSADAGPGIATASGNKSNSLTITGGSTDSVGSYVLSNSNGGFSFASGSYSCTPNTQVYIYALGGDPGYGTNSSASLMAALGNCPSSGTFYTQTPTVAVNEVSTIAAAFALAGFASDSTHISSKNTTAAKLGLKNAFANAANLADIPTATALATTPGGNGTAPQATVNTLANIIAACINSSGTVSNSPSATPCYTLFNNAAVSKSLPSDTATAAINIAQSPASNVHPLYVLGTSPPVPFAGALSSEPTDFTLGIQFTGGGITTPYAIAVDVSGDAWIANGSGNNSVSELASNGTPTTSSPYTGGNLNTGSGGIAIDLSGNAWIPNEYGNSVTVLSSSGSVVSGGGTGAYSGGSMSRPSGIAIDGSGNAWITNDFSFTSTFTLTELDSSGNNYTNSPYTNSALSAPKYVAMDSSGNAWVTNQNDLIAKVSPSGTLFGSGYSNGGLGTAYGIAIDASGNAWVANNSGNSVSEISSTGTLLSGGSGYNDATLNYPQAIAIDGSGNAWVANNGNGSGTSVTELSSAGSGLSGTSGFMGGSMSAPASIALDASGDVWVANSGANTVTEIIGAATPVVTPLAVGAQNGTLGTRP